MTPTIDYFRYDNVWDADVRARAAVQVPDALAARRSATSSTSFNANTVLVRNNNLGSTTFNQIAQNLSPRIFRLGVEVKF